MQDTHVDGMCSRCHDEPARDPHLCPFAQDINDDQETMCDCCEVCTQNCSDDI
jgi:hypothetical protein